MNTEVYVVNAGLLIISILIGAVYCFFGYQTRKTSVPLRAAFGGLVLGLAAIQYLFVFKDVTVFLQKGLSISSIMEIFFATSSLSSVILYTCFLLACMILGVLTGSSGGTFAKLVSRLMIGLSVVLVLSLVIIRTIFANATLITILLGTVSLGLVLLVFCLQHFKYYLVIESSIAGSLVLVWAATKFFPLPWWGTALVAFAIALGGLFIQLSALLRDRSEPCAELPDTDKSQEEAEPQLLTAPKEIGEEKTVIIPPPPTHEIPEEPEDTQEALEDVFKELDELNLDDLEPLPL